jgi:hypothetical protein
MALRRGAGREGTPLTEFNPSIESAPATGARLPEGRAGVAQCVSDRERPEAVLANCRRTRFVK